MNTSSAFIAAQHIDLKGCAYHESDSLTHIDGFLVYYNNHGHLTLSTRLSDEEKLQGIHRLLNAIDSATRRKVRISLWTRDSATQTVGPVSSSEHLRQPEPSPPTAGPETRAAELPSLPFAHVPTFNASQLPLIHLDQHFIHDIAQMLTLQSTARTITPEQEHVLLDEQTETGYSVTLTLAQKERDRWELRVQLEPALSGQIMLELEQQTCRANLSSSGLAVFDDQVTALFLASTACQISFAPKVA
ncbi:MAG TPA: hypothetical protein VGD69_25415 [Herpetosiphonaceae bacterium]